MDLKQNHNSHNFPPETPEKNVKMFSLHSKSIFFKKTFYQQPPRKLFSNINNNLVYSTTDARFTPLNCIGDETLSTSSAYSVLGVPPNCSLNDLKAAFRTKVSTLFYFLLQPPSVTLRVYMCV